LHTPTLFPDLPDSHSLWLFNSLLAHGIAIAGIDVGESYGSPDGCTVFTKFHNHLMHDYGLASKVILLACSRGGLQAYNWASRNPQRIQCIAGIYPVCDLRDYPGLDRAAGAYGLSVSQLEKRLAEFNPIDELEPLARNHVPIMHLHGTKDETVPLESNSRELFRRYASLGGRFQLIDLPGEGHFSSDAFYRNQRLLDFILEQNERLIKP
jgi:pimeloyl-ACP methyl ester carboxylesterase